MKVCYENGQASADLCSALSVTADIGVSQTIEAFQNSS